MQSHKDFGIVSVHILFLNVICEQLMQGLRPVGYWNISSEKQAGVTHLFKTQYFPIWYFSLNNLSQIVTSAKHFNILIWEWSHTAHSSGRLPEPAMAFCRCFYSLSYCILSPSTVINIFLGSVSCHFSQSHDTSMKKGCSSLNWILRMPCLTFPMGQ